MAREDLFLPFLKPNTNSLV
jgi:hypothetical protein